jgi:hypothetical protein
VFASSQASSVVSTPGATAWIPVQTADYGSMSLLPHANKPLRIHTNGFFAPAAYVANHNWVFGLFDGSNLLQTYNIWAVSSYQSGFKLNLNCFLSVVGADGSFRFTAHAATDVHIIGEAPIVSDFDELSFKYPDYLNRYKNEALSGFTIVNDVQFRIGILTPGGSTPSVARIDNTVIEVLS